ncbi:ABC transporter permease [Streptomyces sp. NPDC048710]|uniref:ABC transporter permease n=1 Tax=Streptomyces sp. NPDC048710 TaxID=3365586 RepID=UPI0037199CD8
MADRDEGRRKAGDTHHDEDKGEAGLGRHPGSEHAAGSTPRDAGEHTARSAPRDEGKHRAGSELRDARASDQEVPSPRPDPPARRLTWQRLTLLPAFLVALLLGTWLWFRQADLDPVSADALSGGRVSGALWQHVRLTALSTFLVLAVAIPLGVLLTRRAFRRVTPAAMTVAGWGRATPAIGLLALLVIVLGSGTRAVLIGIAVYAVLPALAHTLAGLKANDPALLEAAHGIGMSPLAVLTRVELPLAAPLILAGVRTALVLNVGTATLAAFGGGGGLGVLITTGIADHRMPVLVLGTVLTLTLALLVDWLASLAEALLRPRGPDSMQRSPCKGLFA